MHLLHLLGVPQQHQANIWNIYRGPDGGPCKPTDCCIMLCEPKWALFNWFHGPCPPGSLHPLWLLQPSPSLPGEGPIEDIQFTPPLSELCVAVCLCSHFHLLWGKKKASLKTTRKVTNLRRADAFRRYFVVLGLGVAGVWIRGLELGLIWVFALS